MMTLNELTPAQLTELYERDLKIDFPPTELKPLLIMLTLMEEQRYQALGLFEGDELLGYALFGLEPGVPLALLDYLGILRGKRSRGIGSAFLDLLADYYRDYRGIFGEAEAPDAGDPAEEELRRRRLGFYLRNGFRYGGYDCALFGVHCWQGDDVVGFDSRQALSGGIQTTGNYPGRATTPEELMAAQKRIHGRSLSSALSQRFLQIPLAPGEVPNPPGNWSEE